MSGDPLHFSPAEVSAYYRARYPKLRQRGREWRGPCPVHQGKRDSFAVQAETGRAYCHSECARGWDIIALEEILTGADFKTAKEEVFRIVGRVDGLNKPPSIEATYDYTDETGRVLYQTVRYSPKDFRQRRPDGKGGWEWNLAGVRLVPYRLPEWKDRETVFICEGEKDANALWEIGIPATTCPMGAGKWRAEYNQHFSGKQVVIPPDNDQAGVSHARAVAQHLFPSAKAIKILPLPDLPHQGDVFDWIVAGGTHEKLVELIRATPVLTAADIAKWKVASEQRVSLSNPWDAAEGLDEFLAGDQGAEFLDEDGRFLARGCLTEVFSPRGLGKSLYALFLAIWLALRGLRVLLIDRDNARHTVRERLQGFGASQVLAGLKVISREKAPRLTDAVAWTLFPYAEYDVVIIDSLNSSAEGIGEQDSAKPSKALAPVLDVCHRENGPAVLLLDNTVRTGAHSRGSGVIEDRADIVYEVRDATGFTPTGKKSWWEELPPADAGSWGGRAARRKGRKQFRLAFIATKFRVGEEPEPFILEIDLTKHPWQVRDITDEVDQEGKHAREARRKEHEATIELAIQRLVDEIKRRPAESPLLAKPAQALLQENGLSQSVARKVVKQGDGTRWRIVKLEGMKGHPKALLPLPSETVSGISNRNTEITEPAKTEDASDGDFGSPLFTHRTEISPHETPINTGVPEHPHFGGDEDLLTPEEPDYGEV